MRLLSRLAVSSVVSFGVSFGVSFSVLLFAAESQAADPIPLRIGWQVPWATQGQLVQIWKHTDILQKKGIKAEFIGRTYGPLLNEVAMAGGLDVVLTGDQPGLTLLGKKKGWKIIGRLMYNRTVTFVPPSSPLKTMKDLKGKSIALPVGAAAERVTREALAAAGLDPAKDTKIVNVDIREQAPLIIKTEGKPTFDQFDAMAGFDPMPAIFETKKTIRVLDVGRVVSVVIMGDEILAKHPDAGTKFMQALVDAYDNYRVNAKQANDWFMTESMLSGVSQEACDLAASIEPNVKAAKRSDIRVTFTPDDMASLQKAADFLKDKIGAIDVSKVVESKYAEKAK